MPLIASDATVKVASISTLDNFDIGFPGTVALVGLSLRQPVDGRDKIRKGAARQAVKLDA